MLVNLLKEGLDAATLECWARERTAAFAVRLHATGCLLKEQKRFLRSSA